MKIECEITSTSSSVINEKIKELKNLKEIDMKCIY